MDKTRRCRFRVPTRVYRVLGRREGRGERGEGVWSGFRAWGIEDALNRAYLGLGYQGQFRVIACARDKSIEAEQRRQKHTSIEAESRSIEAEQRTSHRKPAGNTTCRLRCNDMINHPSQTRGNTRKQTGDSHTLTLVYNKTTKVPKAYDNSDMR